MNARQIVVVLSFLLFPLLARSSESTIPLDKKVDESSMVAIISIEKVTLGKIEKRKDQFIRTQEVNVTATVKELILGDDCKTITFTAYSVFFSEGGTIQSCTAGFSAYSVKKDEQFIAYLKKNDKQYFLAGDSNQYLEKIDAEQHRVTDIGQTGKMVPLEQKLTELRKLAEQKKSQVENTDKKANN